jgi:hypothetical protein
MKRISCAERNISANASSIFQTTKETGEYHLGKWSSQIRYVRQKRKKHLGKFLWIIRTVSCSIHVFPIEMDDTYELEKTLPLK